ncbi:MAG: MBOAT family protein [Pseudomonadota bacterium]|nr:MBOAT family protein [Pseudomonadota bacterium]
MLFPTIEFGLFFAFALALVWSLNAHNLIKKWVLLALSLFFYATWDWRFLLLLLASGAISYLVGLYVEGDRPYRKAALGLGVALDLGILGYFKYLDFFIAQALTLAHQFGFDPPLAFVNVTLPVAISFLTFHAISYAVDVYRGRLKASRSPLDILLYISFFPHLVAGPIVRAHEFLPQLASPRRPEDFGFGENMLLILGGLLKKMVIANYLAVRFVDPVFTDPTQFSRFDLVMAVYAYAIQIYADFSAYTDIAIGVAALLGYRFPQNFNQPYRALGIGDFWRRWHMTLSNWLRDYLYIPLGGNRHGALMTMRNLMLTMLLGGLWHGANWTFLIWGGLHGGALIIDHAYRRSAFYRDVGRKPWVLVADWAATFHFVCFCWLFFRAPSLDAATQYLQGILTDNGAASTMPTIVWPLLAAGALTQFVPPDSRFRLGEWLDARGQAAQIGFGAVALYLIVVMAPSASAPFIYFQF